VAHEMVGRELREQYVAHAARVRELAAPLSDEEFWGRPFPFGNSFGHLVLHLTGNLSYYIGTQIAGTGYVRDRPREFAEDQPPSKAEALRRLDEAVAMVVETVGRQTPEDWGAAYSAVRSEHDTRLGIFLHCSAHMEHHIGQMIYLVYARGRGLD
jgi:uncharacterized damage-inducible protein DinB